MKKNYHSVTVRKLADRESPAWQIYLDDIPLRTPAKRDFTLPNPALAESIAAEWQHQGEVILPHTMPHSQLAFTWLDKLADAQSRTAVIRHLLGYAHSDLVCHRDTAKSDLRRRQDEVWDSLLGHLVTRYRLFMRIHDGFMETGQSEETVAAFATLLESADGWRLTGISAATELTGSLVIAVAMADGVIDAETAFRAAECDALYQMEKWGEDTEARQRQAILLAECQALSAWFHLLDAEIAV